MASAERRKGGVVDKGGRSGIKSVERFLCLCLQGRRDPGALERARREAGSDGMPWMTLLREANAGGVAPILYQVARGHDLLPETVLDGLRQVYYANARRSLLLFRELERVLEDLQQHGVPVVLLKGAALAEVVYDNIAARPMTDIDLLVWQEDVALAVGRLVALGYKPVGLEPRAGDADLFENEIMLLRDGRQRTVVEVHWSLFDSPHHQHTLPLDWFWQTALPIRVGNTPSAVLGPEAQLLSLCGHLLLHHGGGDLRLLWLHDVAEVIASYREEIDWDLALERAQDCDLVLPLQTVLPRVKTEWNAPIPDGVLDRLSEMRCSRQERRIFERLTATHRPVAQRFWTDLSSLPDWKARLRFAWHNLFPSAEYMVHRYHVRRRLLLPFCYLYRWLLGLRSAVGALGAQRGGRISS